MKDELQIKLYDRNLSSPVSYGNILPRLQRSRFSTKLHGGFSIFEFVLRTELAEAWEWLTKRMYYRIVIEDRGKVLWEGRIQDVFIDAGLCGGTAYGYWASMNDGKYSTAYNDVASTVIQAIITAQCPQIQNDYTNFDTTDITINSAWSEEDYFDKSPRDLIEKLLEFGDTSGNQYYFAIWEDRIPYLRVRSTSTIKWMVYLKDLKRFRLHYRAADLWNSAYSVYEAGGAITRTAVTSNTDSQTKYGVARQYAIPNLGPVSLASAQAQRDRWLNEHKDLWPAVETMTLGGFVYDTNKVKYPSSWVRAGETITIIDLVPASATLDVVSRDALRTFFIMETNYHIDNDENEIWVDTPSQRLDAILARHLRHK